jgi:hypothetical protein
MNRCMSRVAELVSRLRPSWFVGVAILSLALTARAQVYHVRAGATGANNGSDWNNAYTSLPATLQRGATYYVAAGNYGSYTFNTPASGTTRITIKRAIESDHGSSTGWQSSYGTGAAVFAPVLQFNTPYWTFDGQVWHGFELTCNRTYSGFGGSMQINTGGNFVTVRGVYFNANYAAGSGHTLGIFGQDTTVELCHFYKTAYEDHLVGEPKGTLTIRSCVFTMPNVPPDGSHRDLFNPYTSGGWNLVFEKNIVYDLWLFGFLLQDPSPIGTMIIRYNVFSTFGHATFRLGSGNGGMGNCTVYNNVFHNCLDLQVDSSKVTERNNIFSRTGGWTDEFGDTTVHASAASSQYNLYTPNTGVFQSGTGNINGGDAMFIDPTSPLGADGIPFTADDGFNIKAGSAAIGKGVNVGLTTDIRGNPVPATPSIGAYEYGAASTNPVISVSPASLNFGLVQTNTSKDLTLTVQNTGAGTLSGSASVGAPFSIVAGGSYNLTANQSQSVTVRYLPTVAGSNAATVTFTGGGGATAGVSGVAAVTLAAGSSIEAEAGTIAAPFVVAAGAISQPVTTDLAGGGRATYSFTVTNAGDYVIRALVNAPSLTENSFYVNIDAEPQDPYMTWDILPPTSGFENRIVSWRGNGTADSNEIARVVFTLQAGSHQLIIRGREANAQLDSLNIQPLPPPPQNLRAVGP